MANYNIKNCLSADTYVVSATSLSVGEVISFSVGDTYYCGTVQSETTDPITPTISYKTTYTSCCECLLTTSGDTGVVSFRFDNCNNPSSVFININTFCTKYGTVPTADRVFKFYDYEGSELVYLCSTSAGGSSTPGVSTWNPTPGAPFSGCTECEASDGPFSANTETELCVVCSGVTSTVIPPHAVYSNAQGKEVVQLNTVALGGPNGLNN